jgi:hypothetical protein
MDEETLKIGCQTLWNNVHQLQSGELLVSLNGGNWIESMCDGFDALQVYKGNHPTDFDSIQPYFLFFREFEAAVAFLWRSHGGVVTAEEIIPIMADKLNALLGHLRIGSNPWPALHTLVRLLERFD